MKKLLLTGASGFLGYNTCLLGSSSWAVWGVARSDFVKPAGVNLIRADLTHAARLRRVFSEVQPDAVIHTAAASRLDWCRDNPEQSFRINVQASVLIAELCGEASIPCVFTSSDMVFDGFNAPYGEEDPVCPASVYGEQKVLAEEGMKRVYPRVVICRMPLMFGDPGPVSFNFFQDMIDAFKTGRELKLFTDEFRTPVSAETAAGGLFLALEKGRGILHLGGRERISRHDFGLLTAEVMGLSKARIIPCLRKDIPMAALRPPDLSLDSSRAFALGYRPLALREQLLKLIPSPHASGLELPR
jgi:dTDP-4-dehydrorhamnose reductase